MTDYGIPVTLSTTFADAVARTRAALAEQGFGVLTEIDVQATMLAKLGAHLRSYLILGACNPPLAHRALTIAPSIGLLLPCNVVVREVEDGQVLVEAMDPDMMVMASGETRLAPVAVEARALLATALANLADSSVGVG
jgi:uncharacterized protein (DUF302 family)